MRLRTAWVALSAFLTALSVAAADKEALQGNPFRGRELLSEKLCTQCHSVWGHGGVLGPDISTAVAGTSWFELVGDFWNHTPRMIDAMTQRGHSWPTLDRTEMADLLSYLYYLRLFDEPGDPARGSVAFTQLHCAACHTLGGVGGSVGGPLDRFSAYPSPVLLAEAMWNAGPVMQRAQLALGNAIPTFAGKEMADIQAYIRSRGLRPDRGVELLPLPDPSRGEALFRAKRCVACHGPAAGTEGPSLTTAALQLTVSEISGILWNHSYAMGDRMRARGIAFPVFAGGELADLISYLRFLGFFAEGGDAAAGEYLFRQRGCSQCHTGSDARAADLASSAAATDPIGLAAAMWNHAPEMHGLLAEKAIAWPTFDPGDMEHLTAYLRKLASRKGDGGPARGGGHASGPDGEPGLDHGGR